MRIGCLGDAFGEDCSSKGARSPAHLIFDHLHSAEEHMLEKGLRPTAKAFALIFVFLQLLALYFLSSGSAAAAYGAPRPPEHSHEALGSLDTVGEVFVNGAAAAAQSTIFAGDVLRSGGTGSATFTLSGK